MSSSQGLFGIWLQYPGGGSGKSLSVIRLVCMFVTSIIQAEGICANKI